MCNPKFQRIFLIAIAIMAVLITGCSKKAEENVPEFVTYRLKWLFNASVAGDIYSDVHGIFTKAGLQVSVKAGGPERDAIKELEIGHAQFGVASADQVIRARSKGSPVVVIAQLFQVNPLQWIYRPEPSPLDTPGKLKGNIIGITYGGNDETIMRALLSKYNITEKDVTFFSVRYDYTPFYSRQVRFWPVYRNTQALVIGGKLRSAGEDFLFLNPDEFGIRFVANSVITTEKMVKERPETVKKFISALLRGWQEALDPLNMEKAVKAIQQFDRDTPADTIREQLNITRSFIKPSEEIEIGRIDVEAWKQTEKIMLEQKLISGPVFVEKCLK
ncbi:MAG: ABC transporter substrate-binding protein [Desulfobacterales bacterium]|nr:ABC transporter substrate-binding protein [Desulfobacterales bacterium]